MDIRVSQLGKIFSKSILYEAIKRNFLSTHITRLLSYVININDSIVTTGPFAGFTALHLACMKNNFKLVKFLIQNCRADVNIMAKDGTQPIHLTCFSVENFNVPNILQVLVEAGANVDAEFGIDILLKYVKDRRKKWCSDFGEKITLLAYAIFNDEANLAEHLIQQGANYKIKSLTNKTLLMLALEHNNFSSAFEILKLKKRDPEFIDARDDENMTAIRYILHPKKFGWFRYEANQIESLWSFNNMDSIIELLIICSTTVELPDKDQPDTFLLNIAAFRSSRAILKMMLFFDFPVNECKVLYYATLPPVDENSWGYLGIPSDHLYPISHIKESLRQQRKDCLEKILTHLVIRQSFSIPVSKEEITLMEELITTDTEVKNLVDDIKKNLNDRVKKRIIKIGDENISLNDFIAQVYNYRKFKILLNKNSNILEIWMGDKYEYYFDEFYLRMLVTRQIVKFLKRIKLLEMLKKVSQLRQHILLPFECILEIVEYLYNEELDKLIKAFENQ